MFGTNIHAEQKLKLKFISIRKMSPFEITFISKQSMGCYVGNLAEYTSYVSTAL